MDGTSLSHSWEPWGQVEKPRPRRQQSRTNQPGRRSEAEPPGTVLTTAARAMGPWGTGLMAVQPSIFLPGAKVLKTQT